MVDSASSRVALFPTLGRIPELDGLRGVAIGLVVITHCLNLVVVPGEPRYLVHLLGFVIRAKSLAWSGVDLFFVLSGFLIGGKLLETRSSPKYYGTFYTRRAWRILPAYLLFLAVTGICYGFVYPSHRTAISWSIDSPHLAWYLYLTFTANVWMALHNTFGARPLSVLWSLAVEEQFYLIAPFLIRFVRGVRLPLVLVTGIMSSLLLRCSFQFVRDHAVAVYVLLPCRIDALLWGILGAYLVRRPEIWTFFAARYKWFWRVFYFLGTAICCASFLTTKNSITTTTIGYDWLDVFYLTTLILVLIDRKSWLGRLMRRSWLTGLGTISYCLYLIHYTVYGLSMGCLLGHSGPVGTFAELGAALFAIALAICLATLSWHLIEKPIMNGGRLQAVSPSSPAPASKITAESSGAPFETAGHLKRGLLSGAEFNAIHRR